MSESAFGVDESGFWEDRYRRGESGWDLGQPAPPLANWLAGAPSGPYEEGGRDAVPPPPGQRVAVLGAGYGHDALLFARAGHTVVGFDFAATAVAVARERAATLHLPASPRRGAGQGLAEFVQADIFALPESYRGAFDLVVEHTFFCAIDPGRRADYVRVVHDLLAPGGRLVGLFYAHGRSGGPPYSTTHEEIELLFNPSFEIVRLHVAPDSIPRRSGEELFAIMRKRA